MFAALFRIVFGLLIASLIGGATQVVFALTPNELIVAGEERWGYATAWTLQSFIVTLIFAAPLVFVIGIFAEWQGIRSFAFYLIAGIFVALAGFAVLYSGEGPQDPTLAKSYAIAAYLTTGFMSGLAYWLVSGRFAGGRLKRRRAGVSGPDAAAGTVAGRPDERSTGEKAGGERRQASSSGTVPITRPSGSVADGQTA